jgi:hypothetical protein
LSTTFPTGLPNRVTAAPHRGHLREAQRASLRTVREQFFAADPTGGAAACHVLRAAWLARQPGKCGMALCPNFVKAQGSPAQLACVGRGWVEFLSEVLRRPDWRCPLGKF